jgi:hypothetical protein
MARGGEKTRVRYSAKTGVYIYLKQNDLFGGGGGSRSVTIVEFSNDFENSIGSIGEKRQKALVQVQNRYSRFAGVSSDLQPMIGRHMPGETAQQRSRASQSSSLQGAICSRKFVVDLPAN